MLLVIRCVNWVLNAVERAEKKYGQKNLRYRIEHANSTPSDQAEDIKRLKELVVRPPCSPLIARLICAYCEQRIAGKDQNMPIPGNLYQTAEPALAFGSDWPVEPLDPRRGLYSAVTRKNIEHDFPEGGWFPEQKLSLAEAIECFTSGSAYASFEENLKGTLEPGKLADLTVFGLDIFNRPPKDILTAPVVYTIVGGKIVYQSEAR